MDPTPLSRQSSPRGLLAVFAAMALGILVGGVWTYRTQEVQLRRAAQQELNAIAELKLNQVAGWRADQLAEGGELSASTFFTAGAARWLADSGAEDAAGIRSRLLALQQHYNYAQVVLVDPSGGVRLGLGETPPALDPEPVSAVVEAVRQRQSVLTDLYLRRTDGTPCIGLVAPLLAGQGADRRAIAAIVAVNDATRYLFPLIRLWPTPSRSAETLLVRRDGESVLFLNEIRHRPDTALQLRVPLSRTDTAAVAAVRGLDGDYEGHDYRGVRVVAVLAKIPDSPWFLVAKVDADEALAAGRTRSLLMLLLLFAGLALTGGAGGLVWYRNQHAHYRDLYQAEARFHAIADHTPDHILMQDRELRYQLVINPQLGLTAADMLGKVDGDFLPPDDAQRLATLKRQVLETGATLRVELPLQNLSGETEFFEGVYVPNADASGRVSGLIGYFRNVTERKRAESQVRRLDDDLQRHAAELEQRVAERTAELVVARERAESADRLKSAFLATMSHELRTPLNSIIGFTGVLLQGLAGPLNAEQQKQLGIVRTSARHLLALINDVLDISKIEADQIEIVAAPFSVREAVEKVRQAAAPLAAEKQLRLDVQLPPDAGMVVSDRRRIEQVLWNLVSNAIKFTDAGGVTIAVQGGEQTMVAESSADVHAVPRAVWRVSVTDTGSGIRPEDLGKLFQPFRQLDQGLARQREGTGLGLAICKRLVERLGGQIEVESQWRHGSTFWFTLPTLLEETP